MRVAPDPHVTAGGAPLFGGQTELDVLSLMCQLLGTPTKEEWPAGYALAMEMGVTFPSVRCAGAAPTHRIVAVACVLRPSPTCVRHSLLCVPHSLLLFTSRAGWRPACLGRSVPTCTRKLHQAAAGRAIVGPASAAQRQASPHVREPPLPLTSPPPPSAARGTVANRWCVPGGRSCTGTPSSLRHRRPLAQRRHPPSRLHCQRPGSR